MIRPSPAQSAAARIERIFCFARDEIAHSFDLESEPAASMATASVAPAASAPAIASGGATSDFIRRGIACRASEVLALGHGLCFAKSHLLVMVLCFAGHPTGFCYARRIDDDRPGRFEAPFLLAFVPDP